MGEPIASRAATAAARTVAAGTARILAAWSAGSALPEGADRRCEGVADFAARRASVLQSLFFTDGLMAKVTQDSQGDPGLRERFEHVEMVYDGANAYNRLADRWTGFFLVDPSGPRGVNDRPMPGWQLTALPCESPPSAICWQRSSRNGPICS